MKFSIHLLAHTILVLLIKGLAGFTNIALIMAAVAFAFSKDWWLMLQIAFIAFVLAIAFTVFAWANYYLMHKVVNS